MKTFIRVATVAFFSFALMLRANAEGEATISGNVKGAAGTPIQGAEIRIQGRDANKIGKIHTNSNGHYSYPGLETGTYNVTLMVDGVTKASINNVRTKGGEVQTLNFDLVKGKVRPSAAGRHYVWIPAQTGTHLGTWIEVEDDAKAMSVGMQERLRFSGSELAKHIQANNGSNINGH
jgi:protocatechuate 3,4-dioxygenase beta subunit